LVLGCTHYPFASDILQALCGSGVQLVDTGKPVARRTRAVLSLQALATGTTPGSVTLLSTGDQRPLEQAASRWLDTAVRVATT
jgi:glutamate racemase